MGTLVQQIKPDNALMRLGDQQVACRVEGGMLVRSTRKIRLYFGTELYAAKERVSLTDKVVPYQPGYMKMVAAMGGTLVCPPAVRDPVTGQMMTNPVVDFVPGTSIVRSVRATGVCVVRDAMGVYHASVQTITVDAELQLRQAMLKIERTELVEILSTEDLEADRAAGKLRGKIWKQFIDGFWLVGDIKAQPIREAMQTANNLTATIRQRACTKAERLACDHNPAMRMSWIYGELLQDVREKQTWEIWTMRVADGIAAGFEAIGTPYAEVEVIGWTEARGQAAMDAFVQALASQQHVDGVESVVVGEIADTEDSEIDNDPDPEAGGPAPRQIAENPVPPAAIQAPKPEPVPVVVAPVGAPETKMVREVAVSRDGGATIESGPETTYSGKPATSPEVSPEVQKLRDRCTSLITSLPEKEVRFARTKSGFGDADISACTEIGPLRRLQTELVAISNDLNR